MDVMVGEGMAWVLVGLIKIAVIAYVVWLADNLDGKKSNWMLAVVNAMMLYVVIHNLLMYAGG